VPAGIPATSRSWRAARPVGAAPITRHPARPVAGRERADHRRLASPRERLDRVDPASARGDLADSCGLVFVERRLISGEHVVDQVGREHAAPFARATLGPADDRSLAREQVDGRVPGLAIGLDLPHLGIMEVGGGDRLEPGSRGTVRVRPGNLHQRVAARERVVHRGQAIQPGQPRKQLLQVGPLEPGCATGAQRIQVRLPEAVLGGASPRLLTPGRAVDAVLLGAPCRQRDPLHPLPRKLAGTDSHELHRPLLDLRPSLREVSQHSIRYAVDLEQPTPRGPPRHPRQTISNLGTQHRPVQRAGRRLVLIQRVRIERRIPATSTGHVRHHHVRVKLRVTRPRHPMPVGRGNEPLATQPLGATMAPPCPARLPLEVGERGVHRSLVRVEQRSRCAIVGDREQHTQRLRRRERQIHRRHRRTRPHRTQHRATYRAAPPHQCHELAPLHTTARNQAERFDPAAPPPAPVTPRDRRSSPRRPSRPVSRNTQDDPASYPASRSSTRAQDPPAKRPRTPIRGRNIKKPSANSGNLSTRTKAVRATQISCK
jgi:hypothetical protein